MNYKGIVDWLQEDDFVMIGFSKRGEIVLMEKLTGKEVNDLPAFLIATVLPIAKKKVIHILDEADVSIVIFEEQHFNGQWHAKIKGDTIKFANGSGETGESAMVNAIETFINNKQEKKH